MGCRLGASLVAERSRRLRYAYAAAEIRLDKRVTSFGKERRKLLIDGQWVDAASGKTFPVYSAATGEVISNVGCRALAQGVARPSAQALRFAAKRGHKNLKFMRCLRQCAGLQQVGQLQQN
jgi:hypothetical protein